MLVEIVGPAGHRENFAADNQGMSLSACLGANVEHVSACFLNNKPQGPDWPQARPAKGDRVTLHIKSGTFGLAEGLALSLLLSFYASLATTAISMIVQALTPKPKAPKADSKRGEAFGIAGFNNTTGPGTPIMVCYGRQRVFGHVVGSYTELTEDGLGMYGGVLYCLGDAGGDGYESISDVQIDGIDADQYPSIVVDTRLGYNDQTVIPGFENSTLTWFFGQTLPWDFNDHNQKPDPNSYAIFYDTHAAVNRVKFQLQLPSGLVWYNDRGDTKWGTFTLILEYKRDVDPDWIVANLMGSGNENYDDGSGRYGYSAKKLGEFFVEFTLDMPTLDEYHFRIRQTSLTKSVDLTDWMSSKDGIGLKVNVYNVEEIQFTSRNYPGYALLAVTRIPGKQIKNLENMRTSALADGKRCKVPDIYDDGPRELITNPGFDTPFDDNVNWVDGDTGSGNSGGAMFNGACIDLWVPSGGGMAKRSQTITVSPGRTYRLTFTIIDAQLAGQTATVTAYAGGDLATGNYTPGDHTLDFVSPSATSVEIILSNTTTDTHAMFRSVHCAPVAGTGNPNTMLLRFTRQRCWQVRDMMTHPVCGMGYEIAEDEIDAYIDQWIEAQDYYDELVASQDGGTEVRDYSDFIVNESRWDWEWIKAVAAEGRGRIIPSGLGWKYVVDKPGSPNLLFAEPGNIIDGSLTLEIAPPDKFINQVIAEFRDEDDDYKPNVSQPISDPDIGVSIIQEGLRYETITRESQVLRENMIVLKRSTLERRRWTFSSPQGAIVSEPLDLDYIAERQIGNEGAYSGILSEAGTTTTVYLPLIATLEVDKTYAIIIRHQDDNTTEYRLISTAAGSWGAVDVTAAFVTAPKSGDLYALGVHTVDTIITRAQDLEIDDAGNVKQIRTEYIPAVYSADDLPSRMDRRNFRLTYAPPLPLRNAEIVEKVVRMRDGSQTSILMFDVTYGLPTTTNKAQGAGGSSNTIILAASEPSIMSQTNYYKTAFILCRGITRKITAYDPESRVATVDQDWGLTIDPDDQYTITWKRFSETASFRIERVGVPSDPVLQNQYLRGLYSGTWSDYGTRAGTTWETNGGDQVGSYYFRFTPVNADGKENLIGRIVKQITLVGDTVAPAPPISVVATGWDKTVDVIVTLQRPVAEDLAGVEIQIYDWVIGGGGAVKNIYAKTRIGTVQDNATSGTMIVRTGMTLGTIDYGTSMIIEARTIDFSNNASDWVVGNQKTLTAP